MPTIRRSPPKEETWESYKARFPVQTIQIAKRAFTQLEDYVEGRRLDWTPKFLPGWLSYKSGRENRVTVVLRAQPPVLFSIKMRRSPEMNGLRNPYPNMKAEWEPKHTEWMFYLRDPGSVPDLSKVLDLVPRL